MTSQNGYGPWLWIAQKVMTLFTGNATRIFHLALHFDRRAGNELPRQTQLAVREAGVTQAVAEGK
jgi:hypothetical protein